MSEELINLLDSVRAFKENIRKEPQERRKSRDRIDKFFTNLDALENKFTILKNTYNEVWQSQSNEDFEVTKQYVDKIKSKLESCRESLTKRLENLLTEPADNLDNPVVRGGESLVMGEKFDLKTAASLLPCMDGSEDVTKQLIDGIELYCDVLDQDGKNKLIKYLLKTKLTQNAKLRLKATYATVVDLANDIKTCLLTKNQLQL